jgi:NAD(P)-dependent dehydrogenase (short-subunit alcohol dehydrogenase family)
MTTATKPRAVIVTGASSGIGLAIAQAYARDGINLVLNARNEAKLTARAAELGAASNVALVAGNISEPETAARLIEAAERRFGGADVLVNNAGIFESKPIAQYSLRDIDDALAMNLRGTILVTQAMVAHLRARHAGGAIVNITSAVSLSPMRQLPAAVPNSTKGALNTFTRSLALELAPEGIRVHAVAPGLISTPLLGDEASRHTRLGALQPVGQLGDPADIAHAVQLLAAQAFATGVVLPIDGGSSLGHW